MQPSPKDIPIVIVVGMGKDTRAIGKNGELLWQVPADLKRFKEKTLGKPVIMGRRTFESILQILGKPLPGRTNIVVTRNTSFSYPQAICVHSLEEALKVAEQGAPSEIHIGGGAELYAQALPLVSKLYVTEYDDVVDGDTYFPPFKDSFTEVARHGVQEYNGIRYEWVDYVRI